MHNWWIAAFENAGVWTREQAEHVSKEIRLAIHKENYKEAFEELSAILQKGKMDTLPTLHKLENDLATLRLKVSEIESAKTTKVVSPIETIAKKNKA